MSQRNSVKWTDFRLRADFPHVDTEIHEIRPYHHQIFVAKQQLDADEFSQIFANQYRILGCRVEFTNTRPVASTVVPPISDDEIADHLSSIPFNRADLVTVLSGMFQNIPVITSLIDGDSHQLKINFDKEIPDELNEDLTQFLEGCLMGRPFSFGVAPIRPEDKARLQKSEDIISSIDALSFKPISKRPMVPNFIAEEESWWFENLEGLFSGRISPRSFNFIEGAGSSCFIGGTAFPQIDIRQALLAYDTIYLQPPLNDGRSSPFWESQDIGPDDLLELIEADRVRILHSQPEERSDLGFLRDAHALNPRGVIGRRRSAALMVAEVVETADEYILAQDHLRPQIIELIERMAADTNTPSIEIARFLLYPLQARRECFGPLLGRGLMAYASMGQGPVFAETYKRLRNKEVELEAGSFGSHIHIAHMLDATYIPHTPHDSYVSTWIRPMRLMGERLNFYRSFNTRIAAAWAVNERRKEERRLVLPPVPLFDFARGASLDEILEITSAPSSRRKGRALISRLADLPPDEQLAEISKLQIDLKAKPRILKALAEKSLLLDAAIGVGAYLADANLFPLVSALTLLKKALECARQAPALDAVIDEIESALRQHIGSNEDISFMSKIDRVACLVEPTSRKSPTAF